MKKELCEIEKFYAGDMTDINLKNSFDRVFSEPLPKELIDVCKLLEKE